MNTRWSDACVVLALVGALVPAPGSSQNPTYTVDRPYPWPESDPGRQGVEPDVVSDALDAGAALPYLYSLLVVRNGFLIGERYYSGIEPTDANTVMSVSKSFLSALVGLAADQGLLDIDQPVMDYFPEYADDLEPGKSRMTLRHLLTMTAGLPGDDYEEEWSRWLESPDWVGYCLAQQLVDEPGESWRYSTCSTHIASAILVRATGTSSRRFARRSLFRPLGIRIGGWRTDPQGVHRGGWDMYFTPRDLARFGHLYLEKGKLEGRRILPRRWARRTVRANVRGASGWGALDRWGYGFWWWTGEGARFPNIYFALGYGGQFVVNVPKKKLTIVATADAWFEPQVASDHEIAIMELIIDSLVVPIGGSPSGG